VTAARLPGLVAVMALLGAGLVAGCSQPASMGPRFPDITFQQYQPFTFAVGQVEIVPEYVAPLAPPNVDHLFPVPPLRMAEQWARDRLVAGGGPGEVRFVIKRASVVETELPRTTGIRGAFTKDQSQRYEAVVEVEVEVRNDRGYRDGIASARAERRQTVAEDISLAERERIWFTMTEALARDLNAELERNIQTGLPRFFIYR
jgi:hypothetical protein